MQNSDNAGLVSTAAEHRARPHSLPFSSRPVRAVEAAVLDGFRDVFGLEIGGVFQVCDGAGNFEDAFENVAEFDKKQQAVVGARDFAGTRDHAAADQAGVTNRVLR